MRQMLHRHSRKHQAASNVNFDVSIKRTSNTTVQRSQVQKQSDDNTTTWEKNKKLWHFDSSRTLMIQRKFQSILFINDRLYTEE